MSLTSGNAPTTPSGTPTQLGWAPGVGPVPIQVGVPTADTTQGANNQQYAPQVVQIASNQAIAPIDGPKATYVANATGLAALASAGILSTLTGSASKVLRLTRIEISGLATSATTLEFVLNKYSTAATGGTAGTAPTVVPHDSADAAAAGAVAIYTAAPTAGTLVGAVRAVKVNLGTSAAACQFLEWNFGNRPGERAIVLRGAAQQLALTTSAAATGSSVDITWFWTEE